MKILADYHHSALWQSLTLLFEGRLGHELYHPWGLEGWFPEYWKIAEPYKNDPSTAKQFLEGALPNDGTKPIQKARSVAFSEFRDTKFDVIVATYYPHIDVYRDLIAKFQPQAKLIVHYGNDWPFHPATKNLLASTAPFSVPPSTNAVFYHQEFDTSLFCPTMGSLKNQVTSFSNALPTNPLFEQDWKDYQEFKSLCDLECKSYGGSCEDGSLAYPLEVAQEMKQSMWGFHLKTGGDGFGHVIHNWAAVGRPLIFRGSQYKGKLAEPFLRHKVTGIDLDEMSVLSAVGFIRFGYNDARERYGMNLREIFEEVVDFEKEAKQIEQFMERLQ